MSFLYFLAGILLGRGWLKFSRFQSDVRWIIKQFR